MSNDNIITTPSRSKDFNSLPYWINKYQALLYFNISLVKLDELITNNKIPVYFLNGFTIFPTKKFFDALVENQEVCHE